MSKPTIALTSEELSSAAVDARVKQQAAVEAAKASFRDAAARPARRSPRERSGSIWHSAYVSLTIFGLLGGLLAGACGELLWSLNPNVRAEAQTLIATRQQVAQRQTAGELSETQANDALRRLDDQGATNPWYRILTDSSLTQTQRDQSLKKLARRDWVMAVIASLCLYCAWGTFIAASLGMAEAFAARNFGQAIVFGSVGAMLGLAGGVVITLCVGPLSQFISGQSASGDVPLINRIVAHLLIWGVLGLFLAIAPGLLMRSRRKLLVGMCGGFIGGALGGALFDPINHFTNNEVFSRMVAVVAIGSLTGLCIATVENVAKRGWLKVVEGLIAGKQFIIYRNPTIIGSHPRCEIFLSKDNGVLQHHAILHIVSAGYVLEDLGSGRTLVNERPISRVLLRAGDQIRIGRTRFTFHETAHAEPGDLTQS